MDSTLFIPRILTYKCLNCSKEVIARQCISSGRYCLIGHNEERVRPFDLFMESLREKCIYLQKSNSYRDDEHIFFTYLYHMRKDCYENKNTIKRKCAEDVMRSLDIDIDKVQECISDSFDIKGDYQSDNSILEEDRRHSNLYGVTINPSLVINR